MSDIQDLQKRALEIRKKYDELNAKDGHTQWTGIDKVAGLNGDVGYLTHIIMAVEGKRRPPVEVDDIRRGLEEELADCFWQILDIASHYDVDIEKAFLTTMDSLEQRLVV